MRRRRSLLALALVASGIGFFSWSAMKKPVAHEGLALPSPGTEVVMHVVWEESSTARLSKAESAGLADSISGETRLDADLILSREATSDGGDAVKAELRDVRSAKLKVSGTELDTSKLAGHPIHLVVESGKIARVLVDKNAPTLAVQITENLARQVLVAHPAKAVAFDRDEETPTGTLKMHYEPKGSQAFDRTITAAMSLTGLPGRCDAPCALSAKGSGRIEFEGDGVILKLSETRNARAGSPNADAMFETKASIEVSRVKENKHDVASLDVKGLASKELSEPFESEADRKAALERRAEGATIEDILGGISTMGTIGSEHLPKGWLVRSTALLELDPKAIHEVAARFEDDGLGPTGRLGLLDLLAATGGDAAKSALLQVLNSDTARRDETMRLSYVQRLMLVEHPSAAMVTSIRDRMGASQATGDAQMAYAEAHVLGSLAGRSKRTPEAKSSIEALAKAVDQAQTPEARAAFLGGLGNAGDPGQVARISKHAADSDPNVRRAVASALRKTPEPSARATLMVLAKDQDEDVQVAAVDALTKNETPVPPTELAQLLNTPTLGGEAEGQLVTSILRQGPPSPEVRGSLEQVLARTGDPRLAARIRFALETAN